MANNNIFLTMKDLKKIKNICAGFEELCKFIMEADLVHCEADLMQLKEMVRMYNKILEKR